MMLTLQSITVTVWLYQAKASSQSIQKTMQVFKAAGFAPAAAHREMQARVGVLRQMTQPTVDQLVASSDYKASCGVLCNAGYAVMAGGLCARRAT